MKHSIKLEAEDLSSLFSADGWKLWFHDGQVITLFADRQHMPSPQPLFEKETTAPVDPGPPQVGLASPRRGRTGRDRKFRGTRAERSAAKKEAFFRILKETGDIKEAAKAAWVTTSMGYRWRANQGKPPSVRPRRKRRVLNPRSRDFNQPHNLNFPCRPCGVSFSSAGRLLQHQRTKHGVKILQPGATKETTDAQG